MSTFLFKVQTAADRTRAALALKGFYEATISLIPQIAGNHLNGTRPTDGTPILLLPGVVVENVSVRAIAYSGGILQAGDIRLTGISRLQLSESQITDLSNRWLVVAPGTSGRYSPIFGQFKAKDTEWNVTLRLAGPQ